MAATPASRARAPWSVWAFCALALGAPAWSCAPAREAAGPPRDRTPPGALDSPGAATPSSAPDSLAKGDARPSQEAGAAADTAVSRAAAAADSADSTGGVPLPSTAGADSPAGPAADSGPGGGALARRRSLGEGDDFFGRATARGTYEIRSLGSGAALGREDWELFEDDAGFRTLRATTELDVDGTRSSRTATVTVTPELSFVEADLGSNVAGVESYATYRHAGDLLSVEAYGAAEGQTRQQVRLPEDAVFVSQVLATRGWELASFDRPEESTRPAYLSGSAPGVLIGEVGTLSGRSAGQEELEVSAGRFRTLLFEIPPRAGAGARPADGGEDELVDRWWVLAGNRIPVAAELPSLGVRIELSALVRDPQPEALPASGVVLARGVYHHRLLRRTEPLAVESWTLSGEPEGGFRLDSEITYADGQRVTVRARADSSFRVGELQLRRTDGRGGESTSIAVAGGELVGQSRGGAVGLVEQRLTLRGAVVFRLSAAALEGWALVAAGAPGGAVPPRAGSSPASDLSPAGPAASDSAPETGTVPPGGPPGRTVTYWLPAGPHPLGTLLELPPDVNLGEERLPTPARTFSTRRYASPAETPSPFRAIRWVFGPYQLPARVLFPGLGREAILVRYETPPSSTGR